MNQLPARAWRPLCLLSLDGGGIRALSSLFILREIMQRLNDRLRRSNPRHQDVHPWQVFDMIGGTSTGGITALMLGRLHMSVQDTIEAYVEFSASVFSETKWCLQEGKYKATCLEQTIKAIVDRHAQGEENGDGENGKWGEASMEDRHESEENCHVFVCAIPADTAQTPAHFRTYPVSALRMPYCKIWEAARATSAAPYFFKPLILNRDDLEARYVDASAGCNNPTYELLNEAARQFPDRAVSCILSLGTGHPDVIRVRPVGVIPKFQLLGIAQALRDIAISCEDTHRRLAPRFQSPGVYFRLNVQQGLQRVSVEDRKKLGEVRAHTHSYMTRVEVDRKIEDVVQAILQRQATITVRQAVDGQ